MINELISVLLIFIVIIICSFLIDYRKSTKYWYVLLIFIFIGFMDNLFHTITIHYPDLQLIKSHSMGNQYFNWSGKLYSITFALIIMIFIKNIISSNDIGLKLKQNKNSIKFSLIFILFFFMVSTLSLFSKKSDFDANTLIYCVIMPGLNEELIYRGLLLGLLNKLFERKIKLLKTYFGWGTILVSIVFGLLHGFQLSDNFQFHFNLVTIILTGIYGFIFALMRERSGSLVFPIIAHSTADFFNFLFKMI